MCGVQHMFHILWQFKGNCFFIFVWKRSARNEATITYTHVRRFITNTFPFRRMRADNANRNIGKIGTRQACIGIYIIAHCLDKPFVNAPLRLTQILIICVYYNNIYSKITHENRDHAYMMVQTSKKQKISNLVGEMFLEEGEKQFSSTLNQTRGKCVKC